MSNVLSSGGLPIRQSRQLPKAQHGAEARNAPKVDFSDIIIIIIIIYWLTNKQCNTD